MGLVAARGARRVFFLRDLPLMVLIAAGVWVHECSRL
jgi:hypothetical protein